VRRLHGAPLEAMKTKNFVVILSLFLLGVCALSQTQDSPAKRHPARNEMTNQIARGKYIVEDVAVCGQCHTPRDSNGEPEPHHELEGAAVWFQPAAPMADWPLKAPRLAGAPPATDAEMVRLLTTGIWTNGKHLRAPMPQFRMSKDDAEAVVAFLKSLTPGRP
jgi:mono/diheme cytochrome c family protein